MRTLRFKSLSRWERLRHLMALERDRIQRASLRAIQEIRFLLLQTCRLKPVLQDTI